MILIKIQGKELWDEQREEFYYTKDVELHLEHSLLSISLWEAKYHKSFIDSNKTPEEMLDYIKMMSVDRELTTEDLIGLSSEQIKEIDAYINNPMTATTVPELKQHSKKKQIITNELVYYWMTALSIPFECEKWHFNHLMMLIKVCAFETQPDDKKKNHKMTSAERAERKARMDIARAKYIH